ncbi:MAG: hypothetical protein F4X31_06465 [Gammaproteobacteria bacterium]|nr:hypothetical protein [Gammaproteobacteria bacterium]MYE85870.1 hypothetical protein [Gammaproteobacteria bacterium]MYF12378.1 hypothetical protein [Gammaproteobacteria bacterium]MYK28156.1 hypothetical protein [Gammaproteobacteria bacterium]
MNGKRKAWSVVAAMALAFAVGAGALAEDATEGAGQANYDVDAILREASPASDYSDAEKCITANSYRSIKVLDDHHLLFEGRRGIWLNRLRHRCPMRGDVMFVVERASSRLCDLDKISGHDRFGGFAWRGQCVLGKFERIEPQQAAALKESVALARQAAVRERRERRRQQRERRADGSSGS